jgi:hypothetical protein
MNVDEQLVSWLSYIHVGNTNEANRATIWVVALDGLEVN